MENQHHPPDLWQILHSPRTQDGPELQFEHFYHKQRKQHKATTLNFGADDWYAVIQRGYSWTDLEAFVKQRECVYVGPFWIHKGKVQVSHTDRFMKLETLYLARNLQQTDHSDDDIKSLVLPFLKLFSLHPVRQTCSIYSQAKWWLSVIQNESDILLDNLYIHKHDRLGATTLHLAAATADKLFLYNCSIVSTSSTPDHPPSINRSTKNRLQTLELIDIERIDVELLKSFIQECTALENFEIWSFNMVHGLYFTSDQWMTLMAVCSPCKTLNRIFLSGVEVETDGWLPGLELLMRSQSISEIKYHLHSYESPTQQQTIPDSLKVSRTNAIVQALMCNKNIIALNIAKSEIDHATFKSNVPPILRCNELWKNITPFCRDMDDTRDSTQLLGRLLSHRLLHQNPSFLFELLCKTNHQLLHMWHDGRHRRVVITPDKPRLG